MISESAAKDLSVCLEALGLPSASTGGVPSIKVNFSSNCLGLLILNPAYFLVPSLIEPSSFARRLNDPSRSRGNLSVSGKALSSSRRNYLDISFRSSS